MALGNIESAIFKSDKSYTEEDMEKARETNQGIIEYEHDLEKYMNP